MCFGSHAKISRFLYKSAHVAALPLSDSDPLLILLALAVDGTARIADIPDLPIMPLYGEGDLITIKVIQVLVECSSLPTITSSPIFPIGHIFSPVNPVNDVVAGFN
uniref:Uncharacterized protein n=1 Tax=Tanacetum cinerariifolium TaxID=118510 RepID=A0A699RBU2_TANCI|nr:hypothetical protein [Tanacetum cinerariifolium]